MVFNGLGKVNKNIDKSVTSIGQLIKQIPFLRRETVAEKLSELGDMDAIEKVDGPTKWTNPLLTMEKPNGEIRVRPDMRERQTKPS